MSLQRAFLLVLGVWLLTTSSLSGSEPQTVSPGDPSRLVRTESRCPTFNWGAVDEARGYELVVYRLADEGGEAAAILRQRFDGPVFGWTPSLDRCLERGGRYAWSVRARGRETDSDWSPPRLFQVAMEPSRLELEEALSLLRRHFGTTGENDAPTPAERSEISNQGWRSQVAAASDQGTELGTAAGRTPSKEPSTAHAPSSVIGLQVTANSSPTIRLQSTGVPPFAWDLRGGPAFQVYNPDTGRAPLGIANSAPDDSLWIDHDGRILRGCSGLRVGNTDSHCYEVHTTSQDNPWPAAQQRCEQWGGYLVTITSVSEHLAVESMLPQTDPYLMWIGYSDARTEDTFEWVTGEVVATGQNTLFSAWRSGQPDDAGGGEDCAVIRAGEWEDFPCDHDIAYYICERDF